VLGHSVHLIGLFLIRAGSDGQQGNREFPQHRFCLGPGECFQVFAMHVCGSCRFSVPEFAPVRVVCGPRCVLGCLTTSPLLSS